MPYTVNERGMKWWKNGAAMPMNAPHSSMGCGYWFHGTYKPVANGSKVDYEDVFTFRHNVGSGGRAVITVVGKLYFRGSL